MPLSPPGSNRVACVLARRSTSRPNCSVKRAAISSSSRASSRSDRLTTVTAVPNAAKTAANSAAT